MTEHSIGSFHNFEHLFCLDTIVGSYHQCDSSKIVKCAHGLVSLIVFGLLGLVLPPMVLLLSSLLFHFPDEISQL